MFSLSENGRSQSISKCLTSTDTKIPRFRLDAALARGSIPHVS